MFIDAHSHWSDSRWNLDQGEIQKNLNLAAVEQISFFLQGGVNPADWQKQKILKKNFPDQFGLSFGLHPYFVSAQDEETCELALDELAKELPAAMALGECGLDFRPHIMKESMIQQIEFFENQLELAKAFKKPMILHVVQAHDKALQILDIWGLPAENGFVHAFTGSFDTAKRYIDRGFYISVGGAVTFDKNRKLLDCVKKIPLEYLLVESDSPDQAPAGWVGLNNSTSVRLIAEKIAQLRGLSVLQVLEITTSNFKRLFRMPQT